MTLAKIKYYAKAVVGGAALVAGAVVGVTGLPTWVKSAAEVVIVLGGVLGVAGVTNGADPKAEAEVIAPAA